MNNNVQKVSQTKFIEGTMYENLQFFHQGTRSTSYIGNQFGNPNQQFIIKQYNQISNDEIEVLKQIKRLQNEIPPKCEHIIKIFKLQDQIISQEFKKLDIVLEKGKDNTLKLIKSSTYINTVQKLNIFQQMVKIVIELHNLDYIIKDLKTENFVYFEQQNSNYKVKLIDFGFIKKGTKTLPIQGNFKYMAPEIMVANGIYDKTANIWSLGIILYELFTQLDFFSGKNQQELLQQMQTQEEINNLINQSFGIGQTQNDLISQMLQKECKNRIQLEMVLEKIDQQLPTIKEQEENKEKIQLKKEKEYYQYQFKFVNQQYSKQSPQILTLQEQLNFYQKIYQQILGQEKILQLIKQNQQITQDIQELEQQEKINQKYDSLQQQLIFYQQFNSKLEALQQTQNKLKISIEEADKSIQQMDKHFQDQHHKQIDDLNIKLNVYFNQFKQQSQQQKYANQIAIIIQNAEVLFVKLNSLKQLISQRTQKAYQEYSQTYYWIEQSLKDVQQQNNQLFQQINNDQQMEQRNAERIKKLKISQEEFKQFVKKMHELKNQIQNLINYQCCNNEQIKKLINDKLIKIDQNISEHQKKLDNFNQFNQTNSIQIINFQITLLENFQRDLKAIDINETQQVNQLKIQLEANDKGIQEKEFLNNQLQNKFKQFSQLIQSINFPFQSIEFYKQMNEKKGKLYEQLKQEIKTLEEYQKIQNQNVQLFIQVLEDYQMKNNSSQQIQDLLKNQQVTNLQKGQRLENIINKVSKIQLELNFSSMDDDLIKQFKIEEEQLSIELNSINEKASNQLLNPQQIDELKEQIIKVSSKIDDLMMKIPKNNEIEEFNKIYQQNLVSYEKLYALVNYIKQYHLTRYNEKIKENANQQKLVEKTQKEKEAQDIFQRYENFLFNNQNEMTIEAMEKDHVQMEKQSEQLENEIKSINLVKLRSKLKNQSLTKQIIQNNQCYKITEFAKMIILQIILKDKEDKQTIQQ